MRLFTAISLPEDFIEEFEHIKSSPNIKGNLHWTKPENLHITTCFIGETEKNMYGKIVEQVANISENTPQFQLDFRNIQLAPPKNKPYMIWVNYNSNESYTELCSQLHFELLNYKKKNYFPHITLARFKGFVKFHGNQIQSQFPSIQVDKIGLWKSDLKPSGPVYEKLEEFQLRS